jgi:hypothetical protein
MDGFLNPIPMVNRDYTKEIGLSSDQPVVPMPIAVAIIAALAVSAWVGHSILMPKSSSHTVKAVATATATSISR